VDIYNVTSNTWSSATLSQKRSDLTAATVSTRVLFFDSGVYYSNQYMSSIDVFDSTNGVWYTRTLSESLLGFAWTTMRDVIVFGGGWDGSEPSSAVYIYNDTMDMWLTATLSQARFLLVAISSTNKILFGGGAVSNVVDIFDFNPSLPTPSLIIPQTPPMFTSPSLTAVFIPTSNYSLNNSTGRIYLYCVCEMTFEHHIEYY